MGKRKALVSIIYNCKLSDRVQLLLTDAKRYGFEIDQVLKSIDRYFLY